MPSLIGGAAKIGIFCFRIADYSDLATRPDLSRAERQRANSYRFEEHRHDFIVRRMVLKSLLARLSKQDVSAVLLSGVQHEKPELPGSDLQFNASSSAGFGVIAIGMLPFIGVDLEFVRDQPGLDLVAEDNFTESERARLGDLAVEPGLRRFYETWTAKEAVLKALGTGLSKPALDVEIDIDCANRISLRQIKGWDGMLSDWRLRHVRTPEDWLTNTTLSIAWNAGSAEVLQFQLVNLRASAQS